MIYVADPSWKFVANLVSYVCMCQWELNSAESINDDENEVSSFQNHMEYCASDSAIHIYWLATSAEIDFDIN